MGMLGTESSRLRWWVGSGAPWVWLQAAAVSACVLLVAGLLLLIAVRGLGHFWPGALHEWVVLDRNGQQTVLVGQLRRSETVPAVRLREAGFDLPPGVETMDRHLLKVGNRDLTGEDFTWVLEQDILNRSRPRNLMVMERLKWGVFIGRLAGITEAGVLLEVPDVWSELDKRLARVELLREQVDKLQKSDVSDLNLQLERLRLEELRLQQLSGEGGGEYPGAALLRLAEQREALQQQFAIIEQRLDSLYRQLQRDQVLVQTADLSLHNYPMAEVLRVYRPNRMSLGEKLRHYVSGLWAFLSEDPREANTEGGIFPAIFGTVLMVFLMTIVVAPLGVVAAVYLKEYAQQGAFTGFLRVAVNNLAGVPSIVYGVFGLGFFIYVVGGGIDRLFFSESLPQPTFGTGGLFWAALTLALLTLPVVIVSTEEGLNRVPRNLREGSLALGATQWETLWRTVLPMASPGIMTGIILAVARAAGEVAPLMLVGVVKLAPTLPIDGNFPFLHLERKFMHLGFHIYDVGFQSPNVEASRPLVYATALLLVLITLVLNMVAIRVRNQLRERYRGMDS
jgi:phosphate transport system permease protein